MTDNQARSFIHGAALSMSWRDDSKSLTDLIFSGVLAAVENSGVDMGKIRSVVLAAHDLVDGRSLSSMVTSPAAGAYLRDEIRLSDDGLAALSLASARVEAGEVSFSIVASWGRASEGDFLATSRASMDPFLQQPFGLSEIDVSGFRLSRWLAGRNDADRDRREAAKARQSSAANNPRALRDAGAALTVNCPLRDEEAPLLADIVVAMVVGSEPSPVRIAGTGHGSDMTEIGHRDLLAMPGLRMAAGDAARRAGVSIDDISIIELDGMTLGDEAIAAEALGLAQTGSGFAALAGGSRINQSGGSATGWCYPAMGLVRATEAYFRLLALPGEQSPVRALATGNGAGGAQTTHAVVLERS